MVPSQTAPPHRHSASRPSAYRDPLAANSGIEGRAGRRVGEAVRRMGPGSEGVGGAGAGKTPPVAGLVGMGLTESARFFELDAG